MSVTGTVQFNPSYDTTNVGTVGRNSSVAGALDLSIPLTLSIPNGLLSDTTVIGDTTADGVADRQIDQHTLESINSGKIFLDIENGLPVALNVKIGLLDSLEQSVLWIPQAPGDSLTIPAAFVSQGDVQSPAHMSTSIALSQAEISRLNLAKLVMFAIGLETAQGDVVNFRTSDNVRIRSWVRLSYRMDP